MNEPNLGQVIKEDEQPQRDAVHIAVAPLIAAERLFPGMHIKLENGEAISVLVSSEEAIGIVDPFLTYPVPKGVQFWLFLYPKTITSLRHNWTHPAFDVKPKDEISMALHHTRIQQIAEQLDVSYEDLMTAANNRDGEYMVIIGSDAHGEIPPEFWDHYEAISGIKVPKEERATYISCSC